MFSLVASQAALRANALEEQALWHAMALVAAVPPDGDMGLAGVHFESSGWGDYYLTADGKRSAKLGQGELGRVDVHPFFSGAVIKTPIISPGIQLRNLSLTEEEVTATTAASAQALASARCRAAIHRCGGGEGPAGGRARAGFWEGYCRTGAAAAIL